MLLLALAPGAARAIVAGDPNGSPADGPNNPYDPNTRTGRLDTLGLDSPFSGVGSINGGTGTLLDSTHVLTAAHLFNQGFPDAGATFVLDTGAGLVSFQSSRVDVNPQYPNGIGQDDRYDIAIVTLSTPVPATFRTYGLYNGPLMPGTTLTLVGYGATGDGVHSYSGSFPGGRRVGQNNVDAYLLPGGTLTETFQPDAPTYEFDFDGPDATTNVFGDGGKPGNLTLGNDRETTLGGGDSGGPAFIFVDGQYRIAALNNFVDKYGTANTPGPDYGFFGSGGGGAIVSAYSDFISGAVAPTPEPGAVFVFGVGTIFVVAFLRRAEARGTSPRVGGLPQYHAAKENHTMATMKAVQLHGYGGPDVLVYEDAPRPEPKPGEILVRVHAAGVNPVDWKIRAGLLQGVYQFPFPLILGFDVAGTVEQLGKGVSTVQVGDAVFADIPGGAYAEYIAFAAGAAALKPLGLDFVQAASVPVVALTAWQALFDHGGLQAGQTVLVHAAAGGVGSFAVQFAHAKGARVIGTASGRNRDFVRGLGADEFVDYTTAKFEDVAQNVDVVFDTMGGETQERSWGVLKPGGILVSIVDPSAGQTAQAHGARGAFFSAASNAEQLAEIGRLLDDGQVKTHVETILPLSEADQAHELSQSGHTRGKIVLKVAD